MSMKVGYGKMMIAVLYRAHQVSWERAGSAETTRKIATSNPAITTSSVSSVDLP
jgi:hypothetical protein